MKIEQLTITRFVAAVSIVVFHYGKEVFPFNYRSISFLFKQADVGVSYFFILSGFVMIIAYGNRSRISVVEYLKNRIARIYPVYLLALLLVLIYKVIYHVPSAIDHYQIVHSSAFDYYGLVLNLFAVQAWVPGNALSFNPPAWSLSVEFFFYAIFPFLFNSFFNKKNYKSIIIPIFLFWLINQVVFNLAISSTFYHGFPSKSHDLLNYFPLIHLDEFLIGNLTGLIFMKKLKEKNGNYDWLLVILILTILILLRFSYLNFHNGLLALLFVPFILLVSLNRGVFTSVLSKKYFIFLGDISYSIYILQFPIYDWSYKFFEYLQMDNLTLKFYYALIILILFSSVSYIFIETPLRKQIKKIRLS